MGRHRIHHFLGQILDEDQGGHEHIGLGDVGTEVRVIVLIAELLDQIAAQLDSEGTVLGVQARGRLGEGILILRLQHHIDGLHHRLVIVGLSRNNPAVGGANLREHRHPLSYVKNTTGRQALPWVSALRRYKMAEALLTEISPPR